VTIDFFHQDRGTITAIADDHFVTSGRKSMSELYDASVPAVMASCDSMDSVGRVDPEQTGAATRILFEHTYRPFGVAIAGTDDNEAVLGCHVFLTSVLVGSRHAAPRRLATG
jgi:hypothetical protein